MVSRLDPVKVLHLVEHYGHVQTASVGLGMHPNSLRVIIARPDNWRLKFAVEAGIYLFRLNRGKIHRGEGQAVTGRAAARRCSSRMST